MVCICLLVPDKQEHHSHSAAPATDAPAESALCQPLVAQVQRDYEELPPDAVPQLRDSLMQLLFKFGTGAPAVRTQLCLAIAALAAHLPATQWGEGGVLRWLMDKFSGQDPAMAMSCMLELLTVLPQVGVLRACLLETLLAFGGLLALGPAPANG